MTAIDPARLAAEGAADADLLRLLREQGDVPHLVHRVDVHLTGTAGAVPPDLVVRADPVAGWVKARVIRFEALTVAPGHRLWALRWMDRGG